MLYNLHDTQVYILPIWAYVYLFLSYVDTFALT